MFKHFKQPMRECNTEKEIVDLKTNKTQRNNLLIAILPMSYTASSAQANDFTYIAPKEG